jgi:hypothetical protein
VTTPANDEHEKVLLVRLAELELERLIEYRRLISDQHVQAYRWLVASLLAVNGGLALSVLNGQTTVSIWRVVAASIFFVGIMTALLSAKFSQSSYDRFAPVVNEWIGYWAKVAVEQERRIDLELALEGDLRKAGNYSKRVGRCGWLSAFAFAIGCTVVALGLLASVIETGTARKVNTAAHVGASQ